MRLRRSFRLPPAPASLELRLHTDEFRRQKVPVNVQRLKETINGREYLIEVSNVGLHKWRAQIRRTPGGSSAMMPFYGSTPDEAAGQLSRWLAIANGPRRDPIA